MIPLKSSVLEQVDVGRKHRLFKIAYPFVMGATGIGLTQVAHQTFFDVGDEIVFQRMSFFYRCTDPSAQEEL